MSNKKEIHFEDIWNEAERVAGIMIDSGNDLSNTFKNIEHILDKARNEYTIEGGYNEQTGTKLVGKILWELCSFCKQLELAGYTVNSASALQTVINEHVISLLEPNDETGETS